MLWTTTDPQRKWTNIKPVMCRTRKRTRSKCLNEYNTLKQWMNIIPPTCRKNIYFQVEIHLYYIYISFICIKMLKHTQHRSNWMNMKAKYYTHFMAMYREPALKCPHIYHIIYISIYSDETKGISHDKKKHQQNSFTTMGMLTFMSQLSYIQCFANKRLMQDFQTRTLSRVKWYIERYCCTIYIQGKY